MRDVAHRHGTLARVAMDAVASGGFYPPDENAAAYGEVVWSWRRDPGVKLAQNIAPATVARKAAHRGEHEGIRKTIARGKPGSFGCTCQSRVRSSLPLHTVLRAQSAPGFPCALF
jgi:hypothetical protein